MNKRLRLEPRILSQLNFITIYLAYFPYFKKMKVGLCDLHALCVSVHPPPTILTLEWLNRSL
jgi:hypothetical protein